MNADLVAKTDLFISPEGPETIVARAVRQHNPKRILVGFSGGHDSMVAAHWCMSNIPGCEVFHIDTGIGVPATKRYVVDACNKYGWPLTIKRAVDCGQVYEDIVKIHGFPGPAQHGIMYARLKERALRSLVRDSKASRRDRIMICTGIYQEESKRRSRYGADVIKRDGSLVWVSPLYFWTSQKFYEYHKAHSLPRNPVKDLVGISGECLCGAYAHKGEKALIRIVCPETADRLDRLEQEVRAAGHNWGWEDAPPSGASGPDAGPMCHGCEKIQPDFFRGDE